MSAGATSALDGLRRHGRLLANAWVYELRKQVAFRTGFLVRELLRGVARPLVMIFVYRAMFRSSDLDTLRGWTLDELVSYLILVATFEKVLFHQRGLDLATQIFDGYVTKYLVMPFRYFVLALGRWLQYVTVQLTVASAVWCAGALFLPEIWPKAASVGALVQAATLVVIGSYCMFLTYFILNALAFWLEVVWSLLVMAQFITMFANGTLLPVSVMPEVLRSALAWSFPYWSLSAPIEIFLGRMDTGDFLRGLLVLGVSTVLLELLRREVWRRGTARYTGSGM